MGCDIHLYVEYKDKSRKDSYWNNLGGRINPGRNYYLFGLMAGVSSSASLFEPKGIPDDMGYSSKDDFYLFISESDNENYVSLETAKRYESYGNKIVSGRDGKPTWVEHPDWHTPSWLSLEEYEAVMKKYNDHEDAVKRPEPQYEAILSAMKRLADFNKDVRIVFWFDN